MLTINDLHGGTKVEIENQPYIVISIEKSKRAQREPVVKATMKNLLTGRSLTRTFSGNEKLDEANITVKQAQFLFKQNDEWHFMEDETFEQYYLRAEQIGTAHNYLTEGVNVGILKYNDRPVSVELPIKIALTVTQAMEGAKGDTASGGGTKEIELETGLRIQAPLFISSGEKVYVNTETGKYVEKA